MAAASQGTIERRSISSTLISLPILLSASTDFSIVLPHATTVTSEPSRTLRALPNGTAEIGSEYSCSAQSKCLGIRQINGSSACIAVQSNPAASAGVLGITTLRPG